jgi:hypothetical protein
MGPWRAPPALCHAPRTWAVRARSGQGPAVPPVFQRANAHPLQIHTHTHTHTELAPAARGQWGGRSSSTPHRTAPVRIAPAKPTEHILVFWVCLWLHRLDVHGLDLNDKLRLFERFHVLVAMRGGGVSRVWRRERGAVSECAIKARPG